jgi:hypothetical protein
VKKQFTAMSPKKRIKLAGDKVGVKRTSLVDTHEAKTTLVDLITSIDKTLVDPPDEPFPWPVGQGATTTGMTNMLTTAYDDNWATHANRVFSPTIWSRPTQPKRLDTGCSEILDPL